MESLRLVQDSVFKSCSVGNCFLFLSHALTQSGQPLNTIVSPRKAAGFAKAQQESCAKG